MVDVFNVERHILHALKAPVAPVVGADAPPAQRALAILWNGGSRVLRSMHVRAQEATQLSRDKLNAHFGPYLLFARGAARAMPRACTTRNQLLCTAADFSDCLVQCHTPHGVVRGVAAGYRFRDACLGDWDDNTDIQTLVAHLSRLSEPVVYVALQVLAQAVDTGPFSRFPFLRRFQQTAWVAACADELIWNVPRRVRRLRSLHEEFVKKAERQEREFIAYHTDDVWGIMVHVCSPRISLHKVV